MTAARKGAVLAASSLCFWLGAGDAAAEERTCRPERAEVRADRRLVWCAPAPDVELVTDAVLSRSRHALAFVTRDRRGALTLVVVLLEAELDRHTMTWAIPEEVHERRRGPPAVMWLGRERVGFGYSEVRPALVASWRVRAW